MVKSSGNLLEPALTLAPKRCARCHLKQALKETKVCIECFDPRTVSIRQVYGPTVAIPGTEAKIQIMRRRAALGLPIFIEGDRIRPGQLA